MPEEIKKLSKANGHIVQVDWNETDPKSFSYIHNKPDFEQLTSDLATEEWVKGFLNDYIKIVENGDDLTLEIGGDNASK